jgi:hypothetical protein
MRTHRYAEGQHVSYADDYSPNKIWVSGYEIVSRLPTGNREPQYRIRSKEQSYDRVVWESQLQEEFGSRGMRPKDHAMQSKTILGSADRRTPQDRADPNKASHRQDLTWWDDEGGAPQSGHHSSASPPSEPEAETALYYFNINTGSGLVQDPEGSKHPDLQAAREAAVAMARDLVVEGDQQGENRQSWRVEIMDRANQPVMTVGFVDVRGPWAPGSLR